MIQRSKQCAAVVACAVVVSQSPFRDLQYTQCVQICGAVLNRFEKNMVEGHLFAFLSVACSPFIWVSVYCLLSKLMKMFNAYFTRLVTHLPSWQRSVKISMQAHCQS